MGNVSGLIEGLLPLLALLFGVLLFVFVFEQIIYWIYPPIYEKEQGE